MIPGLVMGAGWGLVYAWTGVAAVAASITVLSAFVPQSVINTRARQRAARSEAEWAHLIDALIAGIDAGMSIPDTLTTLANSQPHWRATLKRFTMTYRAHGNVDTALDAMAQHANDPIGGAIVDALHVAHVLGEVQLSDTLRDLRAAAHDDVQRQRTLRARNSRTWRAASLTLVAPWIILIATATQPHAAAAWNSASGVTVLCLGGLICGCAYILVRRMGRMNSEQVM